MAARPAPGPGLGAFGAGALTGSLLYAAVGRGWPRRLTLLGCWVLGPLVVFGTLALTPSLGVLVVAGFAGGLLFGPINPIASTVIQEHTPPQLLGRVFGALTALASAGIPIGAVLAGVVVQRAGLVPTIVGMGVLYLLVPLGMFFNQSLRQMDTQRRRDAPARRQRSSSRTRATGGITGGHVTRMVLRGRPATSSRSPLRALLRPGLRVRRDPAVAHAAGGPDPGGTAQTLLLLVGGRPGSPRPGSPTGSTPTGCRCGLMLVWVMLASLFMSAAIPQAFDDRGLLFGAAVAAIHVGRAAFAFTTSAPRSVGPIRHQDVPAHLSWHLTAAIPG